MKFSHPSLALTIALTGAVPAAAQYVLAEYSNYPTLIGVDDAEFTPDGRFLVVRDNTQETSALIYDGKTGAELLRYQSQAGSVFGGPCEDAVVVNDDYGVVIGTAAMFFDLNNLTGTPYAEYDVGPTARDLAMTPDGRYVAVRGESDMFVFDLPNGLQLLKVPGMAPPWMPTAFSVDSVVATDSHAVFTSYTPQGNTRVTIVDLNAAGGPQVVFETTVADDQNGVPHDIAATPDGRFVAVRSDTQVGLYALSGTSSHQVWLHGMANGMSTPFGGSAMDSLVATNTMVATISRRQSGSNWGAQIDAWRIQNNDSFWNLLDGDPHDLDLTPDGNRLVIRTHNRLYLFDVSNLAGNPLIQPLDEEVLTGNWTSWNAGLDSLAVTQDRVLAISRQDNKSKVRVYDISSDTFDKVFGTQMGEPATDVAITPNGQRAVVTGLTAGMVIDLRLNKVVLDYDPVSGGIVPWCDGVAVNDEVAAVFGAICCTSAAFDGWLGFFDLFSRAENYCVSYPNSTGLAGRLVATGSSRVVDNDLTLQAYDLPPGNIGRFLYGDQKQHLPYGSGLLCVTGQLARFPVQNIGPAGRAVLTVDNTNLPVGGGLLLPGTTWNFQFAFRDTAGGTSNLTDAVSVLFE